jgi:hypothetical protein
MLGFCNCCQQCGNRLQLTTSIICCATCCEIFRLCCCSSLAILLLLLLAGLNNNMMSYGLLYEALHSLILQGVHPCCCRLDAHPHQA